MELMTGFAHNIFWFLVVLTLVVFIHELGHYFGFDEEDLAERKLD